MDRTKPWRDYAIVMIDVETTGLHAEADRVVEVAAARFRPVTFNLGQDSITGGVVAETVASLVNPGRPPAKVGTRVRNKRDGDIGTIESVYQPNAEPPIVCTVVWDAGPCDGEMVGPTREGGVELDDLTLAIPPAATEIHGITDEMVATAPTFAEVWPRVLALFSDTTLAAAYSADFDRGFLRAEAARCQEALPLPKGENPIPVGLRMQWLDPLTWVREADRFVKTPTAGPFAGQGRHRLGVTCDRWGIPLEDGHKAEDDAIAAGRLLLSPRMAQEIAKFTGLKEPTLEAVLVTQARLAEEQDERHRAFQKQQEASRGKAAQCKSCGAAIVWISTDAGRAMPIDVTPNVTLGNIRVSADGKSGRVLSGLELDAARGSALLHLSHFASCAQASQHRKPRR